MKINKLIFYTIFESLILLIVICSTYFIWDTFEKETNMAYYYSNPEQEINLQVENNITSLKRQNDIKAINESSKIVINLNNTGNNKKQYYVYFKVNENNKLDTKYLKISLGEVKYLFTLENYVQNNERYFIINKGIINKDETITKDLYLWLSEDTPIQEENKSYNFELNVQEM